VSRARHTSPIPPAPITERISQGPRRLPERIGMGSPQLRVAEYNSLAINKPMFFRRIDGPEGSIIRWFLKAEKGHS